MSDLFAERDRSQPTRAIALIPVADGATEVVLVGMFHSAERRGLIDRIAAACTAVSPAIKVERLGWTSEGIAAPIGVRVQLGVDTIVDALAGTPGIVAWRGTRIGVVS